MICPMTLANNEAFNHGAMECDQDCAWAFEWNGKLSCAIAIHCVGMQGVNAQPLDDDSEKGGE